MKIYWGQKRMGMMTAKGIMYKDYYYMFNNLMVWRFYGIKWGRLFFGMTIRTR